MVHIVCGRKYFTFINIININGLQHLRFNKMADTAFRHHRDGNGFLNLPDHLGIAHAGYAAGSPDVSRYSFQSHHRHRSGRDFGLFRTGYIHNDPAL